MIYKQFESFSSKSTHYLNNLRVWGGGWAWVELYTHNSKPLRKPSSPNTHSVRRNTQMYVSRKNTPKLTCVHAPKVKRSNLSATSRILASTKVCHLVDSGRCTVYQTERSTRACVYLFLLPHCSSVPLKSCSARTVQHPQSLPACVESPRCLGILMRKLR